MESAKIGCLVIGLFLFHSCVEKTFKIKGDHLYQTGNDKALKVKDMSVKHPTEKNRTDSIFLYEVLDFKTQRTKQLTQIISPKSFQYLSGSKYYYTDENFFYCYSYLPVPYQFFYLPKKEVLILGGNYVRYSDKVFYKGVLLNNALAATTVIYLTKNLRNQDLEFAFDGNRLFFGHEEIDCKYLREMKIDSKSYRLLISKACFDKPAI